jgi:hypothetical protein
MDAKDSWNCYYVETSEWRGRWGSTIMAEEVTEDQGVSKMESERAHHFRLMLVEKFV